MTGTVAKLKEKYKGVEVGPKEEKYKTADPTIYLFQKWAYRVEENWYGFDLGGVPFVWGKIIDEFLTALKEFDPNFTICQIKLKFGGLRFYIHERKMSDTDRKIIRDEITELEKWLFHKNLIY